ncbi:hypothetical protein EMIT0P44_430028 [Pseudomonas sp. IT-P44]
MLAICLAGPEICAGADGLIAGKPAPTGDCVVPVGASLLAICSAGLEIFVDVEGLIASKPAPTGDCVVLVGAGLMAMGATRSQRRR